MKFVRSLGCRTVRRVCGAFVVVAAASAVSLAQGTGYWHTSGNKILDANGTQVRIAGINWYGFETTAAVAGGLNAQDYKTILGTIKGLGYNTIRVPFSSQMIESPSYPNIGYSNGSGAINTDLQGLNSLQIMDKIVAQASTVGLKVILDNHRSTAGGGPQENGLWYSSSYTESSWINDWTMLANRYANNPTVIGFDLRNEPHNATSGGACWDCGGANDWHLAAERAGNAVLGVNPNLLIFVEGVDAYNNDYYWWGGNLEGVKNSPVTLSVANRLVYSAHDYGPSVYGQPWFNGSTTPASLDTVWTNHWGFIDKNGIAPLWLGEFGTPNDAASVQNSAAGSEGQWFQSLVGYLGADATLSWTYWALNGEDSLALLDGNYDATPVNGTKQSMLASIQFLMNPCGSTAPAPNPATNLAATVVSASAINLAWSPSSTANVTYSVYLGTSPGATTTVLATKVNGTSYAVTGLNPATAYYFVVRAASSAGATSAASNQAVATTQAAAAPAAPTGLAAAAASSSQINLHWGASATSGVSYRVYSSTASGATTMLVASGVGGTSYTATGLNASTAYFFTVKAVSSAGAASASSNQASATTQAGSAAGACHVAYLDQNDWGTGFTGNLSITNSGLAAINGWTVTWSYAGAQQINQAWNSTYTQSGHAVTLTNASWNATIAAGATLTGIGWNANYTGPNANPTAFYLNGVLCK